MLLLRVDADQLCPLCGLVMRDGDELVVVAGRLLHRPCVEPEHDDGVDWPHADVRLTNQFATSVGRAAAAG